MIKATGVIKTYEKGVLFWKKKTPVLKSFDFEAHPGTVTGLLGPNGAGKTTFFRIVCGLEKITDGSISVNGVDPSQNPVAMRGLISLLPEEPGVARETSGRDHLWVFGAMMGLDKPSIIKALTAADEILHMNSFWTRSFSTYSKGQKARIALARMKMMPNAQVLIFDEPSNGLDFEAVARLHLFIRSLAAEGKTILVASHILSDLRHLCDNLVGIDDGRAATPEKMKAWLDAHEKTQAGRADRLGVENALNPTDPFADHSTHEPAEPIAPPAAPLSRPAPESALAFSEATASPARAGVATGSPALQPVALSNAPAPSL